MQTLRASVECEKRANRSKVSVACNNLVAGNYIARIISGSNTKRSAPKATTGDEAEFDFDSDAGDVAAGATRISRNFIQGQVTGHSLMTRGSLLLNLPEPAVRSRKDPGYLN